MQYVALLLLGSLLLPTLRAAEADALALSRRLLERHLPFGTVIDPVHAGPDSDEIVSYTRCGDSAIWTGHWLAAEAFRFNVTRSAEALEAVKLGVRGLNRLVTVTGTNVLARCVVPVSSPHATALIQEEARHGVRQGTLDGQAHYWVGHTSRDQYSGALFGLVTAYDLVEDAAVRAEIRDVVARMLGFLLDHNWSVVMPDGEFATTFAIRPDQQLALLQIGRRIDPDNFSWTYRWTAYLTAATVRVPIALEVLEPHSSYFKFNLDTVNLYSLIRLEGNSLLRGQYRRAYDLLRKTTDDHGNAHFDMIDRALNGPAAARDARVRQQLDEWLQRPRRDEWVDLRGRHEACGEDRACAALAITERVRTDFLWQRSPFLLYGGGAGTIEGAGIDYLLPYWMARHYGVLGE